MSRAIDDLHPRFRPKAVEFLARTVEAGIHVLVVDTLRTPAEHAANLAKGVSWVKHSKHLDGLAIDVCPYETFMLHGPDKLQWDPDEPAWRVLGELGEKVGLGWGGRWKKKDLGHFEEP